MGDFPTPEAPISASVRAPAAAAQRVHPVAGRAARRVHVDPRRRTRDRLRDRADVGDEVRLGEHDDGLRAALEGERELAVEAAHASVELHGEAVPSRRGGAGLGRRRDEDDVDVRRQHLAAVAVAAKRRSAREDLDRCARGAGRGVRGGERDPVAGGGERLAVGGGRNQRGGDGGARFAALGGDEQAAPVDAGDARGRAAARAVVSEERLEARAPAERLERGSRAGVAAGLDRQGQGECSSVQRALARPHARRESSANQEPQQATFPGPVFRSGAGSRRARRRGARRARGQRGSPSERSASRSKRRCGSHRRRRTARRASRPTT